MRSLPRCGEQRWNVAMDDALDGIRWRDELLQVLYWFRGEGFGEEVTAREIAPLLGADADAIARQLGLLVEEGYVTRAAGEPPRFQLTERGIKEGGRRFADEFAGLTGQAHGECNNPNCACHTLGPEACEAHTSLVH